MSYVAYMRGKKHSMILHLHIEPFTLIVKKAI